MTDTIQVAIITSASTLFAVVITAIASNWHLAKQQKEKKKDLLRDRAEELYGLVHSWSSGMFSNFLFLAPVMKGEYDYNTYLDQIIGMKSNDKNNERIDMIIHSYFPKLATTHQRILEERKILGDIISVHKKEYLAGHTTSTRLNEFTEQTLLLTGNCDELKTQISAILKKLSY